MKIRFKEIVYRGLLFSLGMQRDYRGRARTRFGESTYPRRSLLVLGSINLQELFRAFMSPKFNRALLESTKSLKGSKAGETALILGNGPSLSMLDAEAVNESAPDVWVVNEFYRVKELTDLRITHCVLSDIGHLSPDQFETNEMFREMLQFCDEKNATYILPHWFGKYVLPFKMEKQPRFYFDDRELSAWTKNTRPTKPRGYVGLTLYKALAFAIFLGYEKIYILGMDNTQFMAHGSDLNNSILLRSNHAYSSHLEKDKASVQMDFSEKTLDGMASFFTTYSHIFADLRKFKGPIYNLDQLSLTTAFPKLEHHPWIKEDARY